MAERATILAAHCERCGYELAGLAAAGECPECGRAYNPNNVWRPRRIRWVIEIGRLYSPGIAAGFLLILTTQRAAQTYMGKTAAWITSLVWLMVCVVASLFVALDIAEKGWPASRRRRVKIVVFGAGLIGSAGLLVGWGLVLGFWR